MTPEDFLRTWQPTYNHTSHHAIVRDFLADFRKAEGLAQAAADPYHGKRETLVLPEKAVQDRGITRKSETR